MKDKIIVIDQGTSATKAILFNRKGEILGSGKNTYGVQTEDRDYIRQNPEELCMAALFSAETALDGCRLEEVAGLGICVQTGSFLLWHKTNGRPLTPVVSWQCKSGKKFLNTLTNKEKQRLHDSAHILIEEDGVPAKLALVFKEHPEFYELASQGNLLFGTMESWLIWRLTGGKVHKSDVTNACITRLYLEREGRWNHGALELLKIPESIFPEVADNNTCFGKITVSPLEGLEIYSSVGDSAAAMFGEKCWKKGDCKITYGTGASYLVHLGHGEVLPCLSDIFLGWRISGQCHYVWEGTLSSVGSSVEWLKQLGIIEEAEETQTLAEQLEDSRGVCFFPEVSVNQKIQNLFMGLDASAKGAHLARATLESIAFRIHDMQKMLEMLGMKTEGDIKADGGLTANGFLMQFQADILNRTIICSQNPNMSAFGVFLMTALSIGLISEEIIEAITFPSQCYTPHMSAVQRNNEITKWSDMKNLVNKIASEGLDNGLYKAD